MANKCLIIAGQGVEDSEFFYPYYRMQEEGYAVDVITHNDKDITGKYDMPISPTKKIADIAIAEYKLIIIPGGHEGPDRVRQVQPILDIVLQHEQNGGVTASVCHGPWVLVSAKAIKGKRATCYKGCKDDLINAGVLWEDKPVVVDGKLITAQHFRDNAEWMAKVIAVLHETNATDAK